MSINTPEPRDDAQRRAMQNAIAIAEKGVLRPTAGLRWKRVNPTMSTLWELWSDTGQGLILEQLWQSDTGESEWREVPTV